MIYLITGTPGTGKTAKAMSMVLDNEMGLFKDEQGYWRPLFSVGIPEVNKRILPLNDVSHEDFKAKPLEENFPMGSCIIVDEASEIYPNRSMSSKLPAHVEGLNKLRHYGLTLIIITQHPRMIDPFVLSLVGMHIHLERKQIGSKQYKWYAPQSSFSQSSFSLAESSIYMPDKRVFGLYKSSSMHIKFKKRFPRWLIALMVLPFILVGSLWYASSSFRAMAGVGEETEQQEQIGDSAKQETASSNESDSGAKSASAPITEQDFQPVLEGRPETAPIYDSVRRVVDFPQIVGCVASDNDCTCYTQQGTPVDMEESQCRHRLEVPQFNPYKQPNQQQAQNAPIQETAALLPETVANDDSQVLVMGGKSQQNLMYDGYVAAGEQFR